MNRGYAVLLAGGSVGRKQGTYINGKLVTKICDSIEQARELANRRNRQLSPGEKKYYRMKYSAVPV